MYIIKNALTSIKRNKGRNILIAIIVIVIAASTSITLSIMNSANKIVESYENEYEVEATIEMDRSTLTKSFTENEDGEEEKKSQEEMIDTFNNIESITLDEINNYGTSDYVKNYYYKYELGMNAKDIEEATDSLVKETTTTETTTTTKPSGNMPDFHGVQGGSSSSTTRSTTKTEKITNEKAQNGAFTVIGYSSYEAMTEFIDGTYKITEGEVSSDFTSNNCVISSELATLNDLSVGDTITLVSPENTKKTYEVTITGIYEENSDTSSNMKNMFSNSANYIITNNKVVEDILSLDDDLEATITPTFILTSKEVAENFKEEVESKGLSEYYTVTNNIETIEEATKSITSVSNFSKTFLIITLIIGSVVLLVINAINIRERKYEIGVLRTIGMKKIQVIAQFVFELLVVSIVGLLIGAGIGAVSSVSVANNLLASEISNSETEQQNIDNNFGGHGNFEFNNDTKVGVSNIKQVDSINAIVDIKVLLELLLVGISITIISSLSACIAIARFSPLTILKERS